MPEVPNITMNDGRQIPQLGFGVFQIKPVDTLAATLDALETGYRHIDTAQMYGNEKEVGEAVRRSGLDREDVFVTSKLNNNRHAYEDALRASDQTLADLGLDYVDLFLIHWPLPEVGDFVETWRAMEKFQSDGGARSIGVSNFQSHHLVRLMDNSDTIPAVNQIEVHPYLTQEPLRAFDVEHRIVTEAWSPIAQGQVLDDAVIVGIAERIGRTPAQVVLRWHIQRGDVIFPKSVTPSRVRENFELFDFELTSADLSAISALNRDERIGPDPDTFNRVPE